jgi:UDP-glucose:(heptosyl)LPS alpha-1,3-glucosyltransferase
MKLALLLFRYFPHGGLQRDCLGIACRLRDRGHEVYILTGGWRGPKPEGIEVQLVPAPGFANHARNAGFARRVQLPLALGRFDGVIGFDRIPGLDLYYCADGCFQANAREQHGALYRLTPRYGTMVRLERSVFSADAGTEILLLSERERARYQAWYATPNERFHLLPPVIGRDRLRPADGASRRLAARLSLGLGDDVLAILQIGASLDTKGLDRSLRALASLPPDLASRARLLVAGGGRARGAERLAGKLGVADRLMWLGVRDDVPDLLLAADLLVHPARRENTGQAILEAMVAGLPVLTTAACGYAPHVLAAAAGVVLPLPFEQAAMNLSMIDMLTSPQRAAWSANGVAYGRSRDLYGGLDRAAELIEELVGRRLADRA